MSDRMFLLHELRQWAKDEFSRKYATAEDVGRLHAVNDLADRIDAELAERYMELPLDADGEYIHMGDRMENGELVARIMLTDGSWKPTVHTASTPNQLHEYYCHDIRHYQRDTWERIIKDAIGEGMKRELSNHNGGYDRSDSLSNASLVARCKALAGENS